MTRTIQVKGYTRKTRSGKTIKVKGYSRKCTMKEKSAIQEAKPTNAPGAEFVEKKKERSSVEKWGGPAPKWTAEDYQIAKEISNMSAGGARVYLQKRKAQMAAEKAKNKPKTTFLEKLFGKRK